MAGKPDAEELEAFLAERGEYLMRAAIALTRSRPEAEDLLQAALERMLRQWCRIDTNLEGYLRRTLYNLAADGWRRRGAWLGRRHLLGPHPGEPGFAPDVELVDLRDALDRALRQLPPMQRTVLVLRYWEGLSQAETAAILGCSEGSVKSHASRGIARLREIAAAWDSPSAAQPQRGQLPQLTREHS
jgi:RNA polymerase sigma-70 factor (sigma-E family)